MKDNYTCYICGNNHEMVMTPFEFLRTGDKPGEYFCPYDPAGLSRFIRYKPPEFTDHPMCRCVVIPTYRTDQEKSE